MPWSSALSLAIVTKVSAHCKRFLGLRRLIYYMTMKKKCDYCGEPIPAERIENAKARNLTAPRYCGVPCRQRANNANSYQRRQAKVAK